MGRECIGGDVLLSIIGFGNRDNQICVQSFTERLKKKTYGAIFGNIKLYLAVKSGDVTHRKHKTELIFFLQPN